MGSRDRNTDHDLTHRLRRQPLTARSRHGPIRRLLAERLRSQLVIVGEHGAAAGAERGGGGHAATVVVGAHGRGAVRSGLFGSVSRDLARTGATPVVVCPERT